jgi:phosphate transport system substrate-binding protein
MNDDFLYSIRTEPPPDFVRRLKRRLEQQARRLAARWSITRTLFTGLLVGASTFAAAWWMVGRAPSAQTTQAAQQIASTEQPSRSRLRAAHELEVSGVDGEPHPELGGGALGTGPAPAEERVALSRGPGDAQQVPAPGVATGSAPTAPGAAAMPLPHFGIRVLASPTTYTLARAVNNHWSSGGGGVGPTLEEMPVDNAFDAFCRGGREQSAEIVIAPRRMDAAEVEGCKRNGVTNILETKIGYQAVVLAAPKLLPALELEPRQVFLALAKRVPDPTDATRLVDNLYQNWNEIEWTLYPRRIEVLGPTPRSTTHKLFVELIMEAGCDTYAWIAALKRSDAERYAEICHTLRDDGAYRVVELTPALTAQARWSETYALEILDYDYYTNHGGGLLQNQLRGVAPTQAAIASGEYAAGRPVYLYADNARVGRTPLGRMVLDLYLSERAIGPRGVLALSGLIPLDARERASQRRQQ